MLEADNTDVFVIVTGFFFIVLFLICHFHNVHFLLYYTCQKEITFFTNGQSTKDLNKANTGDIFLYGILYEKFHI
jgi:hypothetical protein